MCDEIFNDIHNEFIKIQPLREKIRSEPVSVQDETLTEFDKIATNIFAKIQLDHVLKANETDSLQMRLSGMNLSLLFEKAKFYFAMKRFTETENFLRESAELFEGNSNKPEIAYLYLKTMNHLAFIIVTKSNKQRINDAISILEKADRIYEDVMEQNKDCAKESKSFILYDADDLFSSQPELRPMENIKFRFEKLATNNKEMLAYLYHKIGNMDKFMQINHVVLERHLVFKDMTILDWVQKVNNMATFYIYNDYFKYARHYLTAAWVRLRVYKNVLQKHEEIENRDDLIARTENASLDVAKSWVLYGIHLFETSKVKALQDICDTDDGKLNGSDLTSNTTDHLNRCDTNLMDQENLFTNNSSMPNLFQSQLNLKESATDDSVENLSGTPDSHNVLTSNLNPTDSNNNTEQLKENKTVNAGNKTNETSECVNYRFSTINIDKVETKVIGDFIKSPQEARDLFKHTCFMIRHMMKMYDVKVSPLPYINCIFDLSELYGFLIFFEDSIDSQYDIQLRRADTLEMLLQVLRKHRPDFFVYMNSEILRELTDIQIGLVELNITRIYENDLCVNKNDYDFDRKIRVLHSLSERLNELRLINSEKTKRNGNLSTSNNRNNTQ